MVAREVDRSDDLRTSGSCWEEPAEGIVMRRGRSSGLGVIVKVCGAVCVAVVLLSVVLRQDSRLEWSEDDGIRPVELSEDDGINGDITRQAKKLIQRAKIEKAHAAQEKQKGADLVTKAQRTCEIAEHLHNTDDGLALRARRQKEAATSLEGRASELLDEADKEERTYQELKEHGDVLIRKGRLMLQKGSQQLVQAAATNGTVHPKLKSADTAKGDQTEDHGGRLILAGHDILKRAGAHLSNAKLLRLHGDKTDAAAKATMALGERFEREAVAHRLKTMTYRSKCTMMRAKAKVHLRRALDEKNNAAVLSNIAKPAAAAAAAAADGGAGGDGAGAAGGDDGTADGP